VDAHTSETENHSVTDATFVCSASLKVSLNGLGKGIGALEIKEGLRTSNSLRKEQDHERIHQKEKQGLLDYRSITRYGQGDWKAKTRLAHREGYKA
jgi:hypothetical protein